MQILTRVFLNGLLSITIVTISIGQEKLRVVHQPEEAIKAYGVCEQFQKILSQNLDFNAAFDSTFTTNKKRQRAIAIKDGEFENVDFATVDDDTLINAYKSRMQLFYLMFPLASPSDEEQLLFFPPRIKEMFTRKGPAKPTEFAAFAAQAERDAQDFRKHLDSLSAKYPSVAERVQKFKSGLVTGDFSPPKNSLVQPLKYSGGGDVLGNGESYYQIEGYTVINENGQMKIAGIRFFTRLF